jgi:hypothetical protein
MGKKLFLTSFPCSSHIPVDPGEEQMKFGIIRSETDGPPETVDRL